MATLGTACARSRPEMDPDAVACAIMVLLLRQKELKKKRKKRMWSRKWLQRRKEESMDPATLRNWIRLDQQQYQELLWVDHAGLFVFLPSTVSNAVLQNNI